MTNSLIIGVRDGILMATIAGKIDGQTAPALQARLLAALDEATAAVFDVSEVSYMSSAGFRLLLFMYRSLSIKGGQLALVGLTEDIRDTMEMTGFVDFFVLRDTLEEALEQVCNDADVAAAR
jgi:anti-sigma B factor antagonist